MDHITKNTLIAEWFRRFTSSRIRRLSREFIWIGLGQAAVVLGAMVGVRILTGVLAPEVYGQLALGMTVATFANVVVLGPLSNGATRFFAPAHEAGGLPEYFVAVKRLVLKASTAILLFVLVICLGLVLADRAKWIGLVLAALCFALLSGYNTTLDGMQNAARQRAVVALHKGLLSWGRFLSAAGLVLWLGASSAVVMLGYCLATVLVLLSQWWFFRRTLQTRGAASNQTADLQDHHWRNEILAYAWPFATWGVLAWANIAADRWALQIFGSTREVGLYAVLFQLGYYPITLAASICGQFLSPVYFQRAGDASAPERLVEVFMLARRIARVGVFCSVAITVGFGLLHKVVFSMLVAPEYGGKSHLLPWLTLSAGFSASVTFFTAAMQASRSIQDLIVPKIVCHVFGVCILFVGALAYGIEGVIFGHLLHSLIYLGWISRLFNLKQAEVKQRLAVSLCLE